jgi:hypothetical protein
MPSLSRLVSMGIDNDARPFVQQTTVRIEGTNRGETQCCIGWVFTR